MMDLDKVQTQKVSKEEREKRLREGKKELAKKSGVTIKDMYWTLGRHDIVAVCDAPDDETSTALMLSVASRGYVRSETLRAFSFPEMQKVLGKMV